MSAEAITDFGQRMHAAPVAGALLIGAVFGGCTAPEPDGMLQNEVEGTACWIESVNYDAGKDALTLEVAVRSTRHTARSLGHAATTVMSRQPAEGERAVSHDAVFGMTDIINTTDKTETHQAVVAFDFEENPRNQYGVLLSILPDSTSSRYCGDMDFVFTQENGEPVAELSDVTTACDQTLGRPILIQADEVDGTKYTTDPRKLLENCP